MRIDDEEESGNVEDRRGLGPAHYAGGGIVLTLIVVVAAYFFHVDPQQLLDDLNGAQAPAEQQQGTTGAPTDPQGAFSAKVLRSTEQVWGEKFTAIGKQYEPPTLVLYDTATTTGCGFGQAAMGPFYCPQDSKVYLDLTFFRDLESRFGAPGQAARAYVIAHEIGHHVQNQLGISARVQDEEQAAESRAGANRVSVKTELQADCFAGVWAKASGRLDAADIAQVMNAASAIGDDRLQRETQGEVVPDSFTHGTSEQRQHWFTVGWKSGDPGACDTFGTGVPGFASGATAP
jgi:predicted metalloprotease